jgi:flagellar motor switch protein FliM
VLEFLSLNCLKDINNFLLEPLFRWQGVAQGDINFALKRGLLVNIRIQIGEIVDIVKLLLPFEFLRSLSQTDNPLLARHNKGGNLALISRVVSGVRLHVILGETIINASEMAVLERGDVILIEHQVALLANSNLNGTVQLRVGDEVHGSLYGDLSTVESLRFQLREVSQRNANEPMRSMMPENQMENQSLDQMTSHATDLSPDETIAQESNDSALALEKVTIKISVELVSRRISLNELANIHIGQIIELGSRATDPVELVADGKTIAIGELIDIEGNLGVRLTRVLL